VEGRAGGSSEAVAGAATCASGEVDAAVGGRGRVADWLAALFAGWARCAVGWDEVNRAKSSRMVRAVSQPDRSNKPTPTVSLTRLLIVIPPT